MTFNTISGESHLSVVGSTCHSLFFFLLPAAAPSPTQRRLHRASVSAHVSLRSTSTVHPPGLPPSRRSSLPRHRSSLSHAAIAHCLMPLPLLPRASPPPPLVPLHSRCPLPSCLAYPGCRHSRIPTTVTRASSLLQIVPSPPRPHAPFRCRHTCCHS